MSQLSYPPVQQALDRLKDLSADAQTRSILGLQSAILAIYPVATSA